MFVLFMHIKTKTVFPSWSFFITFDASKPMLIFWNWFEPVCSVYKLKKKFQRIFTFTDATIICPSRTVLAMNSEFIESPGYPGKYNLEDYNCTLTITVPAGALIAFVAGDSYQVPGDEDECTSVQSYLKLNTPTETKPFCGKRDNWTVVDSTYVGEQAANISLHFFASSFLSGISYKFQLAYYGKITSNYLSTCLNHLLT